MDYSQQNNQNSKLKIMSGTFIVYVVLMFLFMLYYIARNGDYTVGYVIGTTQYTSEKLIKLKKIYLDDPETNIPEENRKKDIILVKPINNTDKWEGDDILVFKKYIGQSMKNKYVILQNRTGRQRIAYCKADNPNFPPVFDGNETLIEFDVIGVLESSYKQP